MKQLLIILLAGVLSTNLNAQVQKGAILTGGYVSYHNHNNSDEFPYSYSEYTDYVLKRETNSLTLSPQIGLFISETTLLGVGITYEYSKNDQQTTTARTSNGNPYNYSSSAFDKDDLIFINPYLTRYTRIMDKLYFTATVNFLAGIGKGESHQTYQYNYYELEHITDDYNELETNIFELRINVTPGFTYFISDKWAVSGNIGYLYYNRKKEKLKTDLDLSEDLTNVDNDYVMNFGINQFTIGIQYYLNNTK